jgi:hypothetical protein
MVNKFPFLETLADPPSVHYTVGTWADRCFIDIKILR